MGFLKDDIDKAAEDIFPTRRTMAKRRKKNRECEPLYRAFGIAVRERRTKLCLRQEDLAVMVGQTRAAIANIELGNQRLLLHSVADFADALSTTPQALLRGLWRNDGSGEGTP